MKKRINYNETFYKDIFYSRLKSIIGSSEKFIKSNKKNKMLISNKLKDLAVLSEFTNTFKNDNIEIKEFKNEMDKFEEMYREQLEKKFRRKDSAMFSNQIRLFIEFIIKYIVTNGYIEESISVEEVIEKLNGEKMFNIILSTAISSVKHIPRIDEFQEIDINEIERHKFQYSLQTNLILHIVLIIIKNNIQGSSIISEIYQNIPKIIYDSSDNNLGQCFTKTSFQLISMFIKIFDITERIQTTKNEKNESRSVRLLTLPEKLVDYNVPPNHIPEIIEPSVNYDTIENEINLSKKVKNGISKVKMSKITRKGLKISQKKKFKINKECIRLFELMDEMDYQKIKDIECLPFTPITHLEYLRNKINELTIEIGEENVKKIKNEKRKIIKEIGYTTEINKILEEKTKISIEIIEKSVERNKLWTEYLRRVQLRILHNTMMKFAEIFDSFPIYFINSFDYRLRMYPWNYMFNRTSGIYKYTLIENASEVSKSGLIVMLKSYYIDDPEKLNIIKEKEKESRDEIYNIFEEIELEEILKKESFIYKYLLGKEIKNLKNKNYRSGFLLEIDQKSSSSVLMSMLLGDKILAEETNLISKDKIKDPNKFIMEKAIDWYKNKLSEESYKIICSNRKIHKYLFMCSIYNQKFLGRLKRVQEYINNDIDIKIIASTYPEFIDTVFPSVTTKKKIFNQIVKFYLEKSDNPIEIETLDGSIISWYIYKKDKLKNSVIKVTDPITNNRVSLRYRLLDIRRQDTNKIVTGLMPSIIHSIDGAIMRLIIIDVYEKTTKNYIINHLHDSIQFHPNKYDSVIKSIENVYTSKDIKNMLEKRFLNRLENNLLEEDRIKFKELKNELMVNNFEEINISKENINIEGMFPLE